jgi:hypothetical protein
MNSPLLMANLMANLIASLIANLMASRTPNQAERPSPLEASERPIRAARFHTEFAPPNSASHSFEKR